MLAITCHFCSQLIYQNKLLDPSQSQGASKYNSTIWLEGGRGQGVNRTYSEQH